MDGTYVAILVGVIAGWSAVILATLRWMLSVTVKALDVRFQAMEKKVEDGLLARQTTEREFLQLKADLPLNYVRREDDIRKETVINYKLDALAVKIDEAGKKRNL